MLNSNTHYLPTQLYSAQQTRELDRIAIEQHGIGAYTLMRRAGRITWDAINKNYPRESALTVFCGGGNNGGDGYIIATLAKAAGLAVRVYSVGPPTLLAGAAQTAYQHALDAGIDVEAFSADVELSTGVIVDALLGTGINKPVVGDYAAVIEQINNSGQPVVSVDVPSGLCANTGSILGCAVRADISCTYIGVKQGLLTADGPACSGKLIFDDLGVPSAVYQQLNPGVMRISEALPAQLLPPRDKAAHKGSNGHVLVVGGDNGFAGAVAMAAEAAARVGAGLVSVATHPEHVSAIIARTPEVMAHGVCSGQELEPLLAAPSVIVLGPGLGQSAWSEQLLQKVMATDLPIVIDADALNILAAKRVIKQRKRDNWILTPHPGEASRLLNCTSAEIQADRFGAVTRLQAQYGGLVVLKGSGTLVKGTNDTCFLCSAGNPGMASGGMGDILSGVLGGLLAQGVAIDDAAQCGVQLHSSAADLAANNGGERGMLASDVIAQLRALVNP